MSDLCAVLFFDSFCTRKHSRVGGTHPESLDINRKGSPLLTFLAADGETPAETGDKTISPKCHLQRTLVLGCVPAILMLS